MASYSTLAGLLNYSKLGGVRLKMFRGFIFRREFSNAVLSAREERESTMSPAQRLKMFGGFLFRGELSNAVLSARDERESTMSPAQRDGEGRNVSVAYDVFLCHSGKQKSPVRGLHKKLTNKGVSCFFDEDLESLPLAGKFPSRIFEAAEKCRIAVAVISKDFIHSKWQMLELCALLKAKSSGKNPHMKILPLFFMLSPKSLSQITVDNQAWKELGISDDVRAEWHGPLREVRSIRGLVFEEAEDVVFFKDEVVKAICSPLHVGM